MEMGSYIRKVYEDTQSLVRDLLAQSERLALMIASLEEEKRHLTDEVSALRTELESYRGQERLLRGEMQTIEEENRRLAGRYGAVEKQSNNLMNLYVASYRLHGTLNRRELVATIEEIVANLIGCEEMALFELDPDRRRLELVTSLGINPEPVRSIPVGYGYIGQTVLEGRRVVPDPNDKADRAQGEEGLTACIPLLLDGQVSGAIALYRLLPQKVGGYEEIDFEIMDLLATHAATALHCTALHDQHREASCR